MVVAPIRRVQRGATLLPTVKKAAMAHELNERYPALNTTPRRARGHVAAYLTAAGRSDLVPSATLIVSELVTNAVVHAGGTIDVRVALTDESLRVDIHDTSDLLPHLRQPDVGGRGLHIVEAIATKWGVSTDGHGKTTWFELRLT
jgi:anti-sigma regulatory factor (Ser/Thr protein kinase)